MPEDKRTPREVNKAGVPDLYPTNFHPADFWEYLGRAVATFGFLEEVLGKAIFALTGTRPHEEVTPAMFLKWKQDLERALIDALAGLVDRYEKAARYHPEFTTENIDELVEKLREAAVVRNALCHGSWRLPDAEGRSELFYFDRKRGKFDTKVDVAFLKQTQAGAAELAIEVMNTIVRMGYQFPGSGGPGKPIWKND